MCLQELLYADERLKTKSTLRSPLIELRVISFSWDIFYPLEMPLQAAVQHRGSSSVPLRSYWQSFYRQAECRAPCRTALLSLLQPDDWRCPHKKGSAESGDWNATIVKTVRHHLDKMHFSVKLDRPLCLLRAPCLCAQHSIHIALSADKPLGFHTQGFIFLSFWGAVWLLLFSLFRFSSVAHEAIDKTGEFSCPSYWWHQSLKESSSNTFCFSCCQRRALLQYCMFYL